MNVPAIRACRITRRAFMAVLLLFQLTRQAKLKRTHLWATSRKGRQMLERLQIAPLGSQEYLDHFSRRSKRSPAARRRPKLLTVDLMAVPMGHSTSSSRWLRLKITIRHSQMRHIRLFIMKGRRRIYLCSLRTWRKVEIQQWAIIMRGLELIRWERLDIEGPLVGIAFTEILSRINQSLMRSNRSSLKSIFHNHEMITKPSSLFPGLQHVQIGVTESLCLLKPKISLGETWIGHS